MLFKFRDLDPWQVFLRYVSLSFSHSFSFSFTFSTYLYLSLFVFSFSFSISIFSLFYLCRLTFFHITILFHFHLYVKYHLACLIEIIYYCTSLFVWIFCWKKLHPYLDHICFPLISLFLFNLFNYFFSFVVFLYPLSYYPTISFSLLLFIFLSFLLFLSIFLFVNFSSIISLLSSSLFFSLYLYKRSLFLFHLRSQNNSQNMSMLQI